MDCKSFDSPLAAALKAARKQHGLTQQDLAKQAALSVPALSRLEHGRGNLSSFLRALGALRLEVVGRNLPARLPDLPRGNA